MHKHPQHLEQSRTGFAVATLGSAIGITRVIAYVRCGCNHCVVERRHLFKHRKEIVCYENTEILQS